LPVLVVNAGSSTLKLSVLDDANRAIFEREEDLPDGADPAGPLARFLSEAPSVDVAGHRVVHGGSRFRDAVILDRSVIAALEELVPLAPLHNPPALHAIAALGQVAPDLVAVACFDTAFHATIPEVAHSYAVPSQWREQWGIRRYGFHGLSHAYASRRAAEMLGRPITSLRTVTCHLGAGASLCAVAAGSSVDTTMGYTPLEGLVMATRSGSLDPGAVLSVQRRFGLSATDVERVLNHQSGLLGLAGTAVMQQVLRRAGAGDHQAAVALGIYLLRLRSSIAAMAASMRGLDVVVFTGGVGENAAGVRQETAAGLGFLGLAVDDVANRLGAGDRDISAGGAPIRTLVVHAREDIEIAESCRKLIASGQSPDLR
jgi:acetate kinase